MNFKILNTSDYEDELLSEGKVKFYIPHSKKNSAMQPNVKPLGKSMPVFFNKRMVFNRDITLLMVKLYSSIMKHKVSFLDAMAATGIRSLRLLKESDSIDYLYINDLNPLAIKYIKKNMKFNGIKKSKYRLFNEDSLVLLPRIKEIRKKRIENRNKPCDIIDIDPFGSPSRYIPAAMGLIKNNGMLCVTATDTPVLFGIRKETCIRKYLTKPIKPDFFKEIGTRILIYYCTKIAHIYEKYVEPVLSISTDHYVRLYLVVRKGIEGVNRNLQEFGYIANCNHCGNTDTVKFEVKKTNQYDLNCPICSNKFNYSGLIWIGKLHSEKYQNMLFDEIKTTNSSIFPSYNKIKKFLELSQFEDRNYPPYYFVIPKIADRINSTFPSLDTIIKKLEENGFNASRTHFNFQAIKTDAKITEIEKVIRNN